MMKTNLSLFFSLLFCALCVNVEAQTTRYVKPTASGSGNGSSWANASNDVQAMINASGAGDAVWVAAGTYTPTQDPFGSTSPTDPRDRTFLLSYDVKVYGGFFGDETTLAARHGAASVLSGDFNGNDGPNFSNNSENAYHVVLAINLFSNTTFDGFTISGGNANDGGSVNVMGYPTSRMAGGGMFNNYSGPIIGNCIFTSNAAIERGGGMFNIDPNGALESPAITNCTFSGNTSVYGSGISNFEGASPVITNCTFSNNIGTGFGYGSAIYNQTECDAKVTNCLFTGNTGGNGGTVRNESSSPVFNKCVFENNTSGGRAGAMYNTGHNVNSGNPLTVKDCIFSGNVANGSPAQGGAICTQGGQQSFTNCVFTGNSASTDGGAVINFGGAVPFTNCTFSGNTAGNGGAMYNSTGTPVIKNCIIWGNTAPTNNSISNNSGASSNVTYSIVEGGYAGTGNSGANPLFANAANPKGADNIWATSDDGLAVTGGSPAVNASNPTTTSPNTDITGYSRSGVFEMGAYEVNPCAGVSSRIYVTTTGTGNGSSWANATSNLQAAINNTCGATEIWVAAGTYTPTKDPSGNTNPTDPQDKTFYLKDGIKVYGGFFGDETTLGARHGAASILSGDMNGNDVEFTNATNNDNAYHVVLTVNDGNTTILDGFTITSGYAYWGNINATSITVEGQTINKYFGGGIHNVGSSAIIRNVILKKNYGYDHGGAMFNLNASPTIENAVFTGNKGYRGGGIYNESASPIIINSVFTRNISNNYGSAINSEGTSTPQITNTTFARNKAVDGGVISNYGTAQPVLTNCILWADTTVNAGVVGIYNDNLAATVSYSIVEGATVYSGTGNSNANPLFANITDPDGADNIWSTADDGLSISVASPAINAGTSTGAPSTDITGFTRTGNPDMGAYEMDICGGVGSRLYVTTTGTGNGSSWANATSNLQVAINNICGATEIWVAAGTYTPTQDPSGNTSPSDPRDKTFLLKDGIKVYGGFFGDETTLGARHGAASVLSGDFNGNDGTNFSNNSENAYHVVLSVNDGSATILDGFTVSGGNANDGGNLTVEGYFTSRMPGAGMFNNYSAPTISNCIFTSNAAMERGGGMFNYGPNSSMQSSTISNCTFNGNTSVYGSGISNFESASPTITNCTFSNNVGTGYGYGSALYNQTECDPVVTNCTFTGNTGGNGGTVRNESSSPTFTNCVFENNTSGGRAGAMYNAGSNSTTGATMTVTNCIFSGNVANGSPAQGGAICNQGGLQAFTNCVFTGNTSVTDGGAVINFGGAVPFTNCTFSGNNAGDGGAIYNWGGTPVIKNCIIWGNTAPTNNSISDNSGASSNVTYSTVEGGYAGATNLSVNPMFVNANDANGADNIWRTADDGLMIGCGTTAADAGTSTGAPSLDILGNVIFGFSKDMGAYEAQNNLTVPTLPTITPSTATTVCAGASVTLTGSAAAEYAWFRNGTFVSYSNTSPDYTFNALAGTYNYTLVAIVTGGYCPSSQSASITVTGNSPATTITPSFAPPYCINTPPVLSASPTGTGYTYSWIGSSPTAATTTTATFTPTTSGNHRVIITDAIGCSKPSAWFSVALNALPAVYPGSNQSVCVNSSVMIGVSPTSGNTYSWTPSTYLSNTAISNPSVTPTTSSSMTYTLKVTQTSTGCSNTGTVSVTALQQPTMPSLIGTTSSSATPNTNISVCEGIGVTLTPSGVTGAVNWYKNGTLNSAATTNVARSFTAATSSIEHYTIRAKSGNCLSEPSSPVSIEIKSAPIPVITATPAIVANTVSICNPGQTSGSAQLQASTANSAILTNYNWQILSSVWSNLSPAVTSSTYTASLSAPQTQKTFRVQANYNNSCVRSSNNVIVKLLPSSCTRMGQGGDLVSEIFTAYPNPTESMLNISIQNSTASEGKLVLYNALGQVITSRTISLDNGSSEEGLDLSGIVTGVYTLSFQTKDGSKVQKIVKE